MGGKKHAVRIRLTMFYGSRAEGYGRDLHALEQCIRDLRREGVTEEWHYYISSKALSAEELLHHARTEWSVETMHWLLDVHFDEDRCRVQSKNIQQNLNMLHKFALNIIRIHKRETRSKLALNGIIFRALMNPQELLPLLGKT